MAEQPVFWLGGKPGNKSKERKPPEAERYEPALREACEACGFAVDEYVAAQGGFGGWLAHLDKGGTRYRVFWSGKTKQLTFDKAQSHGGWQELGAAEIGDEGVAGFVKAVKSLLTEAGAST